jgi:hypothetical protein
MFLQSCHFIMPAGGQYTHHRFLFVPSQTHFIFLPGSVFIAKTFLGAENILPAASITATSATINWKAPTNGTPTNYQWEVRTSGAAGLTASGSATALTTSTGTVLTASTSYSVYVRTRCGTDSSRWSPVVNFTKPCNAPPVLTTTPGSRCGTGTVVLGATTSGTTQLNWYTAATGTGFTYTWYRNNILIAGATTASYTVTTAGTYYAVIANNGCLSTTISRTVVVNPLPSAAIVPAGTTDLCNGGSVVLNANTGAGLTYQWRLNTGNITGATSSAYTASASGNYSVVISNGTCTNTSNDITVNVSTMPVPVINAAGAASFCQGGSVILDATTGPGYTYQWKLNNADIASATASAYSATLPGQYTVTITNGACVATSASLTVTVTPAPTAIVTASGQTTFCQGGSTVLNASRGTGYTYQWTKDGINIPGATTWQYTAVASGDYAVNIFDGTCPAASAPVTVSVGAIPVAVITVTGGVNMSTDLFAAYQWYRNGVIIPGATAQNYTAARDGYYAVVVTDNSGCTATSAVQLITALDVTTMNGNNAQKVSVWPNPSEGLVHVTADIPVDITLLSVDGKQVLAAENTKTIDMTPLAQGLYLIRISDHKSKQLLSIQKLNKK